MREGVKVKVVARNTYHGFAIGEVVKRVRDPGDCADCSAFVSQNGKIWYMQPDEYDLVGSDCEDLLKEALSAAESENFSRMVSDCILLALEEVSFEKNHYH